MDEPKARQGSRVDWRAASAGLVVAVVVQLIGAAVLFGGRGGSFLGQGLLTVSAILLGGFLAGWIGPIAGGMWNGMTVAIGFIAVSALARTILEAQLSRAVGLSGFSSSDMTGLIVGDLVELSGGTLGGWLSHRVRMLAAR